MMLNSQNNMCCLGFMACALMNVDSEEIPHNLEKKHFIEGLATPAQVYDLKWDDLVVSQSGSLTLAWTNTKWTEDAIAINDSRVYSHHAKKILLTEHFAKIGIELEFIP